MEKVLTHPENHFFRSQRGRRIRKMIASPEGEAVS